jgi:type IV secretory pathway TraG/TraD family ATPase VirD4
MAFDPDKVLMRLPGGDWKVDDAMKGVAIFGGTGSGKTSGSGKTIAMKYLAEGWGGLVLCVKTDEAQLWKEYCEKAGRGKDVLTFRNGATYKKDEESEEDVMVFNPIDYEERRPRTAEEGIAEAQNITNIFMNIYRMGNRISGGGENKEERFWDVALKRCINRVVELLMLADQPLSMANMRNVLTSCISLDDVEGEALEVHFKKALAIANNGGDKFTYSDNYCFLCLITAALDQDSDNPAKTQSLSLVKSYFLREFGSMGERVRSTITESFMGLAEPFLSGLMFRHFSGETNLFPEITYTEQKIIILDFSVKEYLDVGIIAQSIYKMMFQQAVERRDIEKYPIPVFLWVDEAQMFVNPYDQIFLTTARSKRVATVFLTQNIPNYLVVMGAGAEAKPKVDSLLGNLSTKVFHANMDAETNEYASRLIGQAIFGMASESKSQSVGHLESKTVGVSMQLRPQVLPLEFLTLKTGGGGKDDPRDNFMVEAFITTLGKEWKWEEVNEKKDPGRKTWRNYTLALFDQNFKLNKV